MKRSIVRKILFESETSNFQYELVHYTAVGELDSIKRKGLRATDKGNLGAGNYFWVSDPLTESNFNADELTLRIKPTLVEKYVDDYLLEQYEKGNELTTSNVNARDLDYLTQQGWKSLI